VPSVVYALLMNVGAIASLLVAALRWRRRRTARTVAAGMMHGPAGACAAMHPGRGPPGNPLWRRCRRWSTPRPMARTLQLPPAAMPGPAPDAADDGRRRRPRAHLVGDGGGQRGRRQRPTTSRCAACTSRGSGDSHDRADAGVLLQGRGHVVETTGSTTCCSASTCKAPAAARVARNRVHGKPLPPGLRGDALRLWNSRGNLVRTTASSARATSR
jgi:hypothetical protein